RPAGLARPQGAARALALPTAGAVAGRRPPGDVLASPVAARRGPVAGPGGLRRCRHLGLSPRRPSARAARRPPAAQPRDERPGGAAGAGLGVDSRALGGRARVGTGGEGLYAVLILGGADAPPERQDVLVAPEVLRKLEGLAARALAPRAAVLLGAEYRGKVA